MARPARVLACTCSAAAMLPLAGCAGVQSALVPRGGEAGDIAPLFWTSAAIAMAVMVLVTILVVVALWGPPRWRQVLSREWFLTGGGIVLPIVVLTFLLVYGILVMQAGATRMGAAGEHVVTVTGKRWWWRVVYRTPEGREVESANELRLPVGRKVMVRLLSDDVIHSFWVPQLAGKLDMIPGRTNVLTLEAAEPGVSRGQCAEYCGGAHALMAFHVVAMPAEEYDAWLAREAMPARAPATGEEERGAALFMANGCGACHTIAGTSARGRLGPDLTHVGSRRSIGAATLPNDAASFARWIAESDHIKPENLMPPYRNLAPDELQALGAFLDRLE